MANKISAMMKEEMEKSVTSLKRDLVRIRTGRASSALVEPVHVDYYGTQMPLNQVANVTTPDPRTIQITPWESNMVGAIEKAILAANIGLTPQNDGKMIRIPIPALTEERRKEMVKLVKKMGEDAKVAIRNHRRNANETIKKSEKQKEMSEDEAKKSLDEIQKGTDTKITEIDRLIESKEKEILTL